MKAERLVQQPLTALYIFFIIWVIRLIPAACQLFSVIKLHREAKLLILYGLYVKEGHFSFVDFPCFLVMNRNQMNPLPYKPGLLLPK